MQRIFILGVILSLFFSCKMEKEIISKIKPIKDTYSVSSNNNISPCNIRSNYIVDAAHPDHTPVKQIKVNIHVMCDNNGKGNFNEEIGREFCRSVVNAANTNIRKNKKMNLPVGNNTPNIPVRYKYVLTPDPTIPGDDGIYFHRDDDYYFILAKGRDRNNYDKGIFKKYGIQKGKVLNVFVQDNHLDSLQSPTYNPIMNGIAFPRESWVKCSNWFNYFNDPGRKWLAPKQLNHEIGHVLGLQHTWIYNDGCDDTPKNANCWNYSQTDPDCKVVSNNVMDYNTYRNAWSPCQIGIAHHTLTMGQNKKDILVDDWCRYNPKKTITIASGEDIEWNSCKDLLGDIIIETDAKLTIRCRTSLPKGAKIIVMPKGKLYLDGARLHNDCGDKWQGIEVWQIGRKRGEVRHCNDAKIENTTNPIEFISPKEENKS